MTVFAGSRYERSCINAVPDGEGVYHATLFSGCAAKSKAPYVVYKVSYGDRLDGIAAAVLGDSELWWRIADANPELLYPDQLTPGLLIRVPTKVVI